MHWLINSLVYYLQVKYCKLAHYLIVCLFAHHKNDVVIDISYFLSHLFYSDLFSEANSIQFPEFNSSSNKNFATSIFIPLLILSYHFYFIPSLCLFSYFFYFLFFFQHIPSLSIFLLQCLFLFNSLTFPIFFYLLQSKFLLFIILPCCFIQHYSSTTIFFFL